MSNDKEEPTEHNISTDLSRESNSCLENGETSSNINEIEECSENGALKELDNFEKDKEKPTENNNIDASENLNIASEERKKRRQEILEKQRKASLLSQEKEATSTEKENISLRENNENTSKSIPNKTTIDRTYVINDAIDFLNNPKLLEYPLDKKINFLKSKGLSSEEIQIALNKSDTKHFSSKSIAPISTMPPPIPPRLYLQKGNGSSLPLNLLLKQLSFLVLISSGVSCVFVLAFKKYALPFLNKIFEARSWILKNRKRQFKNLENECSNLDDNLHNFDIVNDPESNSIIVEQDSSAKKNALVLSSILTKSDEIAKTVYSMNSGRNKRVGHTSSLMKDISGLVSFYCNQIPDTSRDPSVWSRSDSPAAGLKSEIRGLKGILLKNSSKLI